MKISISSTDKEMQKFLEEFQNESQRAAAILGGAYLDNLLKELLKLRFIDDQTLFKKIDNNLTFERCMDLCYLTGAINKKEREDIKRIIMIRNQFAHDTSLNSFRRKRIATECDRLHAYKSFHEQNKGVHEPRDKFNISISMYIIILKTKLKHCERITELKDIW